MTNSVAERFIAKIRGYKKVDRVRGIRASVYTTYNEVWIYVLYSGGTKQGKYWFGIDTRNVDEWRQQKSVISVLSAVTKTRSRSCPTIS